MSPYPTPTAHRVSVGKLAAPVLVVTVVLSEMRGTGDDSWLNPAAPYPRRALWPWRWVLATGRPARRSADQQIDGADAPIKMPLQCAAQACADRTVEPGLRVASDQGFAI